MRSNLRRSAATWTLAAILFSSPAIAGVIDTPLPILPATMKAGKVIFYSSGLRTSATLQVAVHCTNLDTEQAQVGVEFFGFVGDPQNDVAAGNGAFDVEPSGTRTATTSLTTVFIEDEIVTLAGPLNQGSLRVTSTTTKIFCSVQQVDPVNATPVVLTPVRITMKKQKGD